MFLAVVYLLMISLSLLSSLPRRSLPKRLFRYHGSFASARVCSFHSSKTSKLRLPLRNHLLGLDSNLRMMSSGVVGDCDDGPLDHGHGRGEESRTSSTIKEKGKGKKRSKKIAVSELTENAAQEELIELNEIINKHDALYYGYTEEVENRLKSIDEQNDDEMISDQAYDRLVRRAEDLVGRFESLYPLVDKFSRVGYTRITKFDPFQHRQAMLSLDNVFSADEIRKYFKRTLKRLGYSTIESEEMVNQSLHSKQSNSSNQQKLPFQCTIEPKIDGLSLSIHYQNGKLMKAGTRGDGIVGEDVSKNVEYVDNIPKTVPTHGKYSGTFEVRGEVYMTKQSFLELNVNRKSNNESVFSTARNAAAGSLRQQTPLFTKGRNLKFYAYSLVDVVEREEEQKVMIDQSEILERLQSLGFEVATPYTVVDSIQEIIEWCEEIEKQRSSFEYEVDGAVIKVNDGEKQEMLGQSSRVPHWATAYKFQSEEKETVLKSIEVHVGRTGVLTPVAILEPVSIGGVIVERATLHNEAEVRRLGIQPGDVVRLKRSGDVIPKIIGRSSGGSENHTDDNENDDHDERSMFTIPSQCPVCLSDTERDEKGVLIRCTGSAICSAQVIERIRHFCSRDALDIEGLGIARIEELYNARIIDSVADLFKLRQQDLIRAKERVMRVKDTENQTNVEDDESEKNLRTRKGWGDRSVNNLLAAIDDSRTVTLDRFIYALGIRYIGQETSRELAKCFGSFDNLWQYLLSEVEREENENIIELNADNKITKRDESFSKISAIYGVGSKVISSLRRFVKEPRTSTLIKDLRSHLIIIPSSYQDELTPKQRQYDLLANETIVFTGKLSQLTRSEAERLARSLQAKVSNSVSKSTTLLVNGSDGDTISSKLKKATDLDIRIVSEEEFLEMTKM